MIMVTYPIVIGGGGGGAGCMNELSRVKIHVQTWGGG